MKLLGLLTLTVLLGYCNANCICGSSSDTRQNCNSNQCCPWINGSLSYDTGDSESLLYQDTTTPLSFASSSLPGLESDDPEPCVEVEFTAEENTAADNNNYISVLAETYLPGVRLCIRQNDGTGSCATSRVSHCETADLNNNRTEIQFYCDSSCDNSDQEFYFRITTASFDVDDEDWCDTIEEEYPRNLIQITAIPPTTDEDENGGGVQSVVLFTPLLLLGAIAANLLQ